VKTVTWGHSTEQMPFGEWGKLSRFSKLAYWQVEIRGRLLMDI